MTERLLGVVLCGGQSSRMGQDKSTLAHLSGVTFLDHAIDRLGTYCDEVCLSGNVASAKEMRVLADSVAFQGPAMGIATALSFAHQESYTACLITPVDMPDLTRDDLQLLVQQWQRDRRLTLAQSEHVEPLVGIYPVELRQKLRRLADSEDRSLFRWLQSEDYQTVRLASRACRNINTPEDLSGGR